MKENKKNNNKNNYFITTEGLYKNHIVNLLVNVDENEEKYNNYIGKTNGDITIDKKEIEEISQKHFKNRNGIIDDIEANLLSLIKYKETQFEANFKKSLINNNNELMKAQANKNDIYQERKDICVNTFENILYCNNEKLEDLKAQVVKERIVEKQEKSKVNKLINNKSKQIEYCK